MRKALLFSILMVPFAVIATTGYASQPIFESYGYSSDDMYGGGSYLGVDTRDITGDRLAPLKLKEERGVEVTMVDQDAPAGKAGIKEQDVILSINGNEVQSVEELRRMIREIPPGRVINIGISRDGQPMSLKAQLADRKKAFAFAGPTGKEFHFPMPAMPVMPALPDMDIPVSVVVVHSSARSGLMVENLTPQLGDFFGARNGQGVLVRSVEKGSNAERSGFRAGDIITKVNSESVSDSSDFTRALRSLRAGGTVNVNIIRDKKEQTLTLTLPERRQSGSVIEESLDDDDLDMDADTRIDLRAAETEMAEARPRLELAVQEAKRAAEEVQREYSERQTELQEQQEELREQLQQQQQELRDRQREIQEQLQEQQEQFRDEMQQQQEELQEQQQDIRGGRADI